MNNEDFYKSLLNSIDDGIYFVDKNRKITFWNKGAEMITGFLAEKVMKSYCFDNILNHVNDKGDELCHNGCPLHKTLHDGKTREAAVYLHHKEGYRVPVAIKVIAIKKGEKIIGAVEVFNNNSKRHETIKRFEELEDLAMRDQLTGLPNRRFIDTILESKMHEYNSLGVTFAIAFMDIDNFRNFNNTYGHDVGDEVLKMVSNVFKGALRGSDYIGRWGGEEFMGIITSIDNDNLYKFLERVRMLVEKSSLRKDNQELKVTISIGATIVKKEDTIEAAVKRADKLLYESKSAGRNIVSVG